LRPHRAHRDVGLVAREIARRHRGVELDRKAWVALAQPHQRGRDEHARDAGCGRDPDHAFGEALDIAGIAGESRVRGFHRLGRREHALGRARRREPFARAVEQALAEVRLERREAAAHRRGIDLEPRRGGHERALAIHGEEDPDVIPADVRGLRFCHLRLRVCALPCIPAMGRVKP